MHKATHHLILLFLSFIQQWLGEKFCAAGLQKVWDLPISRGFNTDWTSAFDFHQLLVTAEEQAIGFYLYN